MTRSAIHVLITHYSGLLDMHAVHVSWSQEHEAMTGSAHRDGGPCLSGFLQCCMSVLPYSRNASFVQLGSTPLNGGTGILEADDVVSGSNKVRELEKMNAHSNRIKNKPAPPWGHTATVLLHVFGSNAMCKTMAVLQTSFCSTP